MAGLSPTEPDQPDENFIDCKKQLDVEQIATPSLLGSLQQLDAIEGDHCCMMATINLLQWLSTCRMAING